MYRRSTQRRQAGLSVAIPGSDSFNRLPWGVCLTGAEIGRNGVQKEGLVFRTPALKNERHPSALAQFSRKG
jgi:hypothetical protein